MTTPLASRTTISSRNKMVTQTNGSDDLGPRDSTTDQNNMKPKLSNIPPPSQFLRDHLALKTPAPSIASSNINSRLASLANGLPSGYRRDKSPAIPKTTPETSTTSQNALATTTVSRLKTSTTTSRPIPQTSIKTSKHKTGPIGLATSSRIAAPRPRLASTITNSLNSRTPSVVSSISSTATTTRRPLVSTDAVRNKHTDIKRQGGSSNQMTDTLAIRRNLAKFSNPIECQRQIQTQNIKIQQLNDNIQGKDKKISQLQGQLEHSLNLGIGYATVVQYFAAKLKLNSSIDLPSECEQLKVRIDELLKNEKEYKNNFESIVDDYNNHLKIEHDLRNELEKELETVRVSSSQELSNLCKAHESELIDLNEKHSSIINELETKVDILEKNLEAKCKEISELRREHEELINNFNKLEESLTKDKDARVKYAQEKISQLQKDVESLNSVLEMRLERIHALEKDSILLAELQSELIIIQDSNKALKQQIESLNAALDKRREEFEKLVTEHEKVSQELKRERKERRLMTMKTEELEFALNESCGAESNLDNFNKSVRDISDGSDNLI